MEDKLEGKYFTVKDHIGQDWKASYISCPVCNSNSYRELFKLIKSRCNPQRPVDTFVKCAQCGLVYINPRILFPVRMLKGHSQEESLEDIDFHANMRLSDYEFAEDLERIREFKPTGRLLEIGSATGAFLSLASKAGYYTLGVEPRARYVEYARHRFGVDVLVGLIGDPRQSIELPADEFDVVVMLAVIEHVLDVQKFIQALHRFLRPGGVLYFMTPDVESLYARIYGLRWNHYHVSWHHQFFSKCSLQRLLSDNGFHILKTWGGYRGRQSYWRRMIKSVLSRCCISLDVITVLAEKTK